MPQTAAAWNLITNTGSLQTIAPTTSVFVQTTGVLQVAGDNLAMVNWGTVQAGTMLAIEVHQIGASNTAVLVALR